MCVVPSISINHEQDTRANRTRVCPGWPAPPVSFYRYKDTGGSCKVFVFTRARQKDEAMRQHSNSSIGSCPLPGNRALHSALISPTARGSLDCTQPVLLDMGACTTGIVATFSPGGKAAKHLYTELNTLGSIMTRDDAPFGRVRAVVYGKGAHCPTEAVPLSGWLHSGQAHCFQGPNVGARESHTIWQFVAEFYDHLPRVTLFVQDDPEIGPIREMQRMPQIAMGYLK